MTRRLSNNSHVFSMLVVPALAATAKAARALVRTRVITVAILAVLGLSLVACGGSSAKSSTPTPTPTVVAVSTNVSAATVSTTGTMTFTASVTGSSNTAVTWSVQEASGGTVTQAGVYTPPATAGTYHVLATSQADTTKVASIAVTVTVPASVSVGVKAASPTVFAKLTDQFTATVTGSSNTAVTWSIQEGATGGSISAAGLYTAPSTAGTYHVVATSQADTTKSASLAVSVTIPNPTFTSVPSPTLAQASPTYTYPITATDPSGTTITYTLPTPVTGASIAGSTLSWTPTGTAPLTGREMPTSFTVKATTALGGTATQTWTVTPLRQVSVTFSDSFWNAGSPNPVANPLYSLVNLGVIVPGSTATPCVTGGISATLCGTLTSSTGTYTIDNVPAGFYWLVNGPTERYWTNVSLFDGSTDFIGQLLSAQATAQPVSITGLTLDATSGANVLPNDVIWIGSPNTTAWWAPQVALPTTGYSLTDATETIALGTLPTIEPGDPSYVLQFSAPAITSGSTLGYAGMSIAADEPLGTSFSFASTVAGTLADSTPQTLSFKTTNWGKLIPSATYNLTGGPSTPRLVYFGTYLASMPYITTGLSAIGGGYPSCNGSTNPANTILCTEAPGLVGWPAYTSAAPDSAILGIPHEQNTREAGGDFGPLFLAYAALDSPTCSAGVTTLCTPPDGDTVSMPVDNAFASSMVLSSQVEVQVPLGYTQNFSTISTSQFSVTSLTPTIVDQPVIYPVTTPLINTHDLFTSTTLSAPLTLSWTASTLNPAISGGKVSGYHVMVYAAPASGSNWGAMLADLATANTSVLLPTLGLAGGTYVFVIEAKADALATPTANPWHSKYPRGTAQIVSAPITISGYW